MSKESKTSSTTDKRTRTRHRQQPGREPLYCRQTSPPCHRIQHQQSKLALSLQQPICEMGREPSKAGPRLIIAHGHGMSAHVFRERTGS